MPNLAGLHDREGQVIAPPDTWIVDTIALSENPQPTNYVGSLHWIGRLNWGYGERGTLPVPDQYPMFAQRVAAYVAASKGCSRWIIGNEPNLPREWPDGQPIYPWSYAACYKLCRDAIHALSGHEHDEVLIAVPGPWNDQLKYPGNSQGDWIGYFLHVIETLEELGGEIDGFSAHAYTHGYNPALVKSEARMNAPFQNRRYEFHVYQDFMEATPSELSHLPWYITEANGNGPWQAVGLMPAMLADVNEWNQRPGKPKVRCVVFFRYPDFDDGFYIEGKGDVIAEYRAAVALGYQAPEVGNGAPPTQPQGQHNLFIPIVSTPMDNLEPTMPERNISEGFKQRTQNKSKFVTPAPGQRYFELVKAEYVPNGASLYGPDHHILVEVLDLNGNRKMGQRVTFVTDKEEIPKPVDKQGGPYGVDLDMYSPGYGYGAFVGTDRSLSDYAAGMGMGTTEQPDWAHHVDFHLTFQEKIAKEQPQPQPPTGKPNVAYVSAPAGARLRSRAPDGNTLAIVPYRDAVVVQGHEKLGIETWAHVRWGDKEGWIYASLLGDELPDEQLTQPTEPQPAPTNGALDPLLLEAIVLTESGGEGFEDGRLKIRLEAHLLLGPTWGNPARFGRLFRHEPDNILIAYFRRSESAPWVTYHAYQDLEWEAFEFARSLDEAAALRCTSMGAGQIMGFNAKRVGYGNPRAMFEAFSRGEIPQMMATINYCLSDARLIQAIQRRDWNTIIREYNGEGLEAIYAPRLIANYMKVGGTV